MLSQEENERLTRVDAGSQVGTLLRRYWYPIATSTQLEDNPVKGVKLLGESLVLFRDRKGRLGLIDERCPHRRVSLRYGVPEEDGLRCCYHGWMFDGTGRCLEMPAEPPSSTFKDRVRTTAYPVEELGGLIFAYLGPEPVPLLPRWDLLVMDGVWRDIGLTTIPCSWMQCMENSLDPAHTEWLHGHYYHYVMSRKAARDAAGERVVERLRPHHLKIGFDVFAHGIIKRRMRVGGSEEEAAWRIGHPILFPNILGVRGRHAGHRRLQRRRPLPHHGANLRDRRAGPARRPGDPWPGPADPPERGRPRGGAGAQAGRPVRRPSRPGPVRAGAAPALFRADARELRPGGHPTVGPGPLRLR